MRKLPPGIQIMDPRFDLSDATLAFTSPLRRGRRFSANLSMDASSTFCARALCMDTSLDPRVGLRHEIERRSARDELFSFFAFLKFPNNSARVLHHPPTHVPLVDGLAFFRVLHKMRNAGKAQRQFRVVKVLLALEVDLEVLPFDGVQFFIEPDYAGVSVRGLLLAKKEWTLVDAVDDPIARRLASSEPQQSGEHIRDVNHLIALGSGLDSARPADQERRANASFRRTKIRAIKKTSRPPASQVVLGAVVAAVNNDGIVGNPKLVELIEQHAEVMVEHQQAITPIAVGAFPRKLVARDHREVQQRVIEIEEKRLAR